MEKMTQEEFDKLIEEHAKYLNRKFFDFWTGKRLHIKDADLSNIVFSSDSYKNAIYENCIFDVSLKGGFNKTLAQMNDTQLKNCKAYIADIRLLVRDGDWLNSTCTAKNSLIDI